MNIIHRITIRTDGPATGLFESLGFRIKAGIINGYDIGESDSKWPHVQEAIKRFGNDVIGDFQFKTEFTKDEINSASFSILFPKWHFEYPQPSNEFGYKAITYRPGAGCRKCGVGLEQQNPFSIKRAPDWGKRNILQLNWVFGEYFVSKDMKKKIEGKIPDIRFLEVVKYRQGTVVDDIFQMVVERHVLLSIPQDMKSEVCDACHSQKYLPHTRGPFPMPLETDFAIAKSREWFGSGGSARQEVIISRSTRDIFCEAGIVGAGFTPCGT